MVSRNGRFWRDESGVSLIEGLIVFPLVFTAIVTLVEFGFAVFQWNQAGRAVAAGARLAVVSDPVTDYAAVVDYTGNAGDPVPGPGASVSYTCAPAVVDEPSGCSPGFQRMLRVMQSVDPRIRARNVRVTYTMTGLGYIGRLGGPVVTVTVELRDLTFQFFLLGKLLGLDALPIPATPVTFTSEDMASCASPIKSAVNYANPCPTPTPTP